MTTRQGEWDESSRAHVVAFLQDEAARCGGCGGLLEETTADEREERYRTRPPARCHYCTAIAQGSEEYREAPHPHALLFPVELR